MDASTPEWLRSARIWAINGIDGFRFLRCPFSVEAQLQLVRSALSEWIEPPSANNLATAHGVSAAAAADHTNLWARHSAQPDGSLLSKLTWATVGYQYQWTPREYDPRFRSHFPAELAQLASALAGACGWSLRPEAAIINLYSHGSLMGGHRDDAEPCQDVPIVSISLGLDCVYLLGGETKATPPVAMRLRSGDVIVQGGLSRGYVHGVPRVLRDSLPAALQACGAADADDSEACARLAPFARWLRDHRLNINVRQVFAADPTAGDSTDHADLATVTDAPRPQGERKRLRDVI